MRTGVAQWPGCAGRERAAQDVSGNLQVKRQQRGNTLVGIIIGVVLGLAAALAVAVYVTKVPVPFVNKGPSRSPEQDAAESRKHQNWDPNAPLYGTQLDKALPPATGIPATGPTEV